MVKSSPDAILAVGAPVLRTFQEVTHSIPIVFVQVEDPVGTGFVASMSRPGGNITGFTHYEYPIGGKWLKLLKEIAPAIKQVLVVQTDGNPSWLGYWREISKAAPTGGQQLVGARAHDIDDIELAIEKFARQSNGGLIMLPDSNAAVYRDRVVAVVDKNRLPAVFAYRYMVTAGGLMSYSPTNIDAYPRAASYIDRILRGEKPGELPIQQPDKFGLVINLKTAKVLGITVPPSLLATAAEVIE